MLKECWELKEARSKKSNDNAINGLESESINNVKLYDVLSTKIEELKGPAALRRSVESQQGL